MTDATKNILRLVILGFVALLCIRWAWVREGEAVAEAKASAAELATVRGKELPALRDSLQIARDSNARNLARVDTLIQVRAVTVLRADTIRVRADSLAIVASLTSDTGAVCRPIWTAYQVRTSECAQLRVAVTEDSTALRVAREGLASSGMALRDALGQVEGLRQQLGQVAKPYQCKIVWFVPCLSRKASFLVGLLGGGAIVLRTR